MPPKKPAKGLSYSASGVNISKADATKEEIAEALQTKDKRVLNTVGSWAFASLVEGTFPGYQNPVLVLKTEEPGSKQLLAFQEDKVESICQDMINHLVNDIAVMGATPLFVQDAVICGKLEQKIVTRIVKAIAEACKAQGCILTGGETSEQPGVLQPGVYILTSSIIGVVDRMKVIDGSQIREGDTVLAIASNGLHTNGYSLVRALLKKKPALRKMKVGKETFLDAILKPHTCYYQALRSLYAEPTLHGMAHITGSGIEGNLERVLPKRLDAVINLEKIRILPVFETIRDTGNIADAEMLRTYNLGVGLTMVVDPASAEYFCTQLRRHGHECYKIGKIAGQGKGNVRFAGKLRW